MGYCLYKDGQLVPPQDTPPPAQVPPQSAPPYYGQNTVDANGQCCPQPNPISINITNSQDTNSRNMNSRHVSPARTPVLIRRYNPPVAQQPAQVQVQRVIQRVPYPVVQRQRVIQRVPYPVIQRVPVEVVKQVEVPVLKNTYTERVITVPVTGCEGKEYFYPAFY